MEEYEIIANEPFTTEDIDDLICAVHRERDRLSKKDNSSHWLDGLLARYAVLSKKLVCKSILMHDGKEVKS